MLVIYIFLISLASGSRPIQMNSSVIICPVLAAMYNAGDLIVDECGNVELMNLRDALMEKLGVNESFATFQAWGVAAYTKNDNENTDRQRMLFIEKDQRYLNIFKMVNNPNVRHGFGTGFRISYSKDTFENYVAKFADVEGYFYIENLEQMICHASYCTSDKVLHCNGEFSNLITSRIRQWQMHLAVKGMLYAFGRQGSKAEQIGDNFIYSSHLYLTLDDIKQLYIKGQYPTNWHKRPWGCMYGCDESVFSVISHPLKC